MRRCLLDGSRQLLHLRVRLLDRALLLHRRVVAELLVGRELHLRTFIANTANLPEQSAVQAGADMVAPDTHRQPFGISDTLTHSNDYGGTCSSCFSFLPFSAMPWRSWITSLTCVGIDKMTADDNNASLYQSRPVQKILRKSTYQNKDKNIR